MKRLLLIFCLVSTSAGMASAQYQNREVIKVLVNPTTCEATKLYHNTANDTLWGRNSTSGLCAQLSGGGGGSGDVVGPLSSTARAIPRYGDASGKLLEDTAVLITDTNTISATNGTAGAPSFSFTNDPDTGLYKFSGGAGATGLAFATDGTLRLKVVGSTFTFIPLAGGGTQFLTVNNSGDLGATASAGITNSAGADVVPKSDGLNLVASQVSDDGTSVTIPNARLTTTLQLPASTWITSSDSKERFFLETTSTTHFRSGTTLGAGLMFTFRDSDDVTMWSINTGHLLTGADNTYDIGASGATRPRTGYFGTGINAPLFTFGSLSKMSSPSDGIILITDNAGAAFSRLQLGGATNAFPALATNGTQLRLVFADNSGMANLAMGSNLALADQTHIIQSADGVLVLTDSASTSFGRLQLGGTTSSYPSIKRNGTALNFRLADDSGDAPITSGGITAPTYSTTTNCSDSAGAAACGAAAAGSVVIDAGSTSVVVSTTAVTANSQIFVQYDSSLGARLGVTCNTTVALPAVTARTATTSFTFTVPVAPAVNPACYSFWVVN